jgi:hypothetical protein
MTNVPDDDQCPLDRSWRLWGMFGQERRYDRVSPEDKVICDQARRATPVRHLGLIELAWRAAADDGRKVPMTSEESGDVEWRWAKGSPQHVHVEIEVDGHRVHVDRASASKRGPGNMYLEFRIFVDGRLAGRGGRCGTSLGVGGSDLPAVARVGPHKAITLDEDVGVSTPIAELWEVNPVIRS